MNGKIRIQYETFLNASGYSIAAQNYLEALHKTNKFDIKVGVFGGNISRPAISDEKYEFFAAMKRKEEDPDRIQIYHCIPKIQRRTKRLTRNIGFATYECFSPPQEWIDILNKNDGIITPSKFNYNIFSHAKIKKPIFHVPHCLDFNLYNREVKPLKKFDKFTFLFMGTWKERKGYKPLIEAWLTEFADRKDVQLMIKTDQPDKAKRYVERVEKQYRNGKGFSSILFESEILDEKTLPKFIKSFDCIVLPSMGEGFSVPGLQGMALGIPVIITNFSGCQDYANEETATLIEPSGFILKGDMDGIPQFRNKKWAFISVENIKKTMHEVLSNSTKIEKKVDYAYSYVKENFNYSRIGNLFIDMLGQLYGL